VIYLNNIYIAEKCIFENFLQGPSSLRGISQAAAVALIDD
jgi:hypothetical protein